MMQPTQHGNGANLAQLIRRRSRKHRRVRNPLPKPLMGSSLMKVQGISLEEARELFLMENEEVIQAFSSHAPQEAFTDSIRSWSPVRSPKHLNATCCCHPRKTRSELAIIIPNQVFWSFSIRSRLSQLLCDPEIGRSACHIHMDDPPRFHVDDEKGKKRAEKQISDL